jgi:ketosteroid isomerase-like protein
MTDSGHDLSAGYTALDTATQQWADAFNRGDAATIAGMMSADAQIMPPNGGIIEGREAIQAFWQGFIDTGVKGSLTSIEITVEGSMGYKVGTFRILDAEGGELDHGKFLEIWRYMDGAWQFHRDMWNSSVPTPEGDG